MWGHNNEMDINANKDKSHAEFIGALNLRFLAFRIMKEKMSGDYKLQTNRHMISS